MDCNFQECRKTIFSGIINLLFVQMLTDIEIKKKLYLAFNENVLSLHVSLCMPQDLNYINRK